MPLAFEKNRKKRHALADVEQLPKVFDRALKSSHPWTKKTHTHAAHTHLVVGIFLREQDRHMGGDETRSARDEHVFSFVRGSHGVCSTYSGPARRQGVVGEPWFRVAKKRSRKKKKDVTSEGKRKGDV